MFFFKIDFIRDRIGFHSYFNTKNLLMGETIIVIPIEDITGMDKKINAKIFDNAITISTKKGDMIFASIIGRDKCLEILLKIRNKDYQHDEELENNLHTVNLLNQG